jgi:DNA invertase Pin-like site-specific DNA recombinase
VPKIAYSYVRFSTAEQAKGTSPWRQKEWSRHYAAQNGFILDESLKPDRGISAFKGRNRTEGNLAAFLARVKDGTVPRGSALLVESLDRLSREEVEEALYAFLDIIRSGIEIHTCDGQVYIRGKLKAEQLLLSIFHMARANEESERKSERCGAAWSKKRQNANGKEAMSARVPAWLKAVKGQPIRVIPERVTVVRKMFEWAAKGLGQYVICDKLIKGGVSPWGPARKGKPPRWTPFYVSSILSSRSVIGEYTPHTKKIVNDTRKRVADGAPVENYYPAVIPLPLWQRVQEARRAFAQAKFGESFKAGKDLHSDKNLFKRLLFDANNDAPMVYRHGTHPYLVTTHRQSLRQHKINYALFEKIILEFLTSADWKAIHRDGSTEAATELLAKQESLAREIEDNEKVLKRYESLIDDPNSTEFERISDKYKTAVAKSKKLMEERATLEAQIASENSGSHLLLETKGIDIFPVGRTSKEDRLKLRLYLAQRIQRIDLTFGATVLTAGPGKNVQRGEGKLVAKLTFVNGAVKWAFIDKDRAVLLS